ncbi:MAG: hypothetical protein H6Q13_393 [Bacteroidetes bacterium]|jgi:hypothetical protein|nr:hypothetical protein [Bacteroidota bacterium]
MSTTRRNFIKTACLGGACLCGFSSILEANPLNTMSEKNGETDSKVTMNQFWIAELLNNLDANLDKESVRKVVKSASLAHYNDLKMENILAPYKGKLEEFVPFLEKEWGWICSFEGKNTLIANENKPHCVCPLVKGLDKKFPALCYCSEGFAERMFGYVCQRPVKATVISSVFRGEKSCVYQIGL